MRSGTAYIANAAPSVSVTFWNISGSIVGAIAYNNHGIGAGTQRRLIYAKKIEEPYSGKGLIRLLNDDKGLNSVGFLGCMAGISWGYIGGTGSTEGPLWVTSQKYVSDEGVDIVELELVDAWEMMAHSRGINVSAGVDMTNPATGVNRLWPRDTTVLNIITELIQNTGSFTQQWGLTTFTTISAEPAGPFAIQTYMPYGISRLNDSDLDLIRYFLRMTQTALTFRWSTGPTLTYIPATLPGPYTELDLAGTNQPFFIHINGDSLPIPNRVIYVDQEPDPTKLQVALFYGLAELATFPLGRFGRVFFDYSIGLPHANPPTAPEIAAGNTEAAARASAHLNRIIAESVKAEAFIPMNCTMELYDEVRITDSRNGKTTTGRPSIIEREFKASALYLKQASSSRDLYTTRIHFGGIGGGSTRIKSASSGANDIETTIGDFKARSLANPFVDSPQINQVVLSQHLAPLERSRTATALTAIPPGAPGAVTPIIGCTRTFTLPEAAVARITGTFPFITTGAGLAGDQIQGIIVVNAVAQAKTAIWTVPLAGAGIQDTRFLQLDVPLPAGSNTIALSAQVLASVGPINVTAQATLTVLVMGNKNAEIT